MALVCERRRHPRTPLVCPVTLLDKGGRVRFRGRAVDVSAGGIRIVGPPPAHVQEGLFVWVELMVPDVRSGRPRTRCVKLSGEVRRVTDIGDWKGVVVIIFESDFSKRLVSPDL